MPRGSFPFKVTGNGGSKGEEKGLLWRLPTVKTENLGKLGPGFGLGAGCGVGLGFGIFGGAGFGLGLPGLHLGFGVGAGCGIGLGFGYGLGRGVAYDEYRKHSNVGKMFRSVGSLSSGSQLSAIFEDIRDLSGKRVDCVLKKLEDGVREIDKKLRSA